MELGGLEGGGAVGAKGEDKEDSMVMGVGKGIEVGWE